jgi:hypothetical protein
MPNWCNNVVSLKHSDVKMLERAQTAFNRGELCNEFVPVPPELMNTEARGDTSEAENMNFAKFGYHSWYDFCVSEWGTKWDVGADSYGVPADIENGELNLTFDSAWAPPTKFYEVLNNLGFEVKAFYYESGMGFAGVWEDGFDDYYEYHDMSAAEAELALPSELNEMFCISETMAEYEDENQEIDLDGGLSAVNEEENDE